MKVEGEGSMLQIEDEPEVEEDTTPFTNIQKEWMKSLGLDVDGSQDDDDQSLREEEDSSDDDDNDDDDYKDEISELTFSKFCTTS